MAIKNTLLGGVDWSTPDARVKPTDLNDTFDVVANRLDILDNKSGKLGEVRQFDLDLSGAVTKASLQASGWAICDGTTPASQGITDPTIETTRNMQHSFIRMSDDESSGGTGGTDTHDHTVTLYDETTRAGTSGTYKCVSGVDGNEDDTGPTSEEGTLPTYIELVWFVYVKEV